MIDRDADLMRGIRQKDKKSFEQLYKLYYKKNYLLAYKYLRNQEQAEEIAHDVFLKLWNNGDEILIKQSLGAYLSRSIINGSLNLIKKQQRFDAHIENYQYSIDEVEEFSDEAQLLEDKLERLEQAIETLPPQCRKVLMMSKFENCKQQEIADALNISIKTVKNHLTLGYEKIRVMMKKDFSLLIAIALFQLLGIGLMFHGIVLLTKWY
ncbi:RNA polymerase sigma-70 factor [Pedobacter riviphilus]|uniref:RNA polymerase sigma-70 factor n=1 Tax=Pedobacter riviphilus TaxID=2766984 RepID=A0ABX6TQD0_9SPHI|nr:MULTISPECIES: RNA polymerase sigma-70 factor [Pedobacter]NII83222.1 RNA polymerase sigma-70 factor (ECF subfamily) [Pedobacter sp. SG908]QNR86810.1 RNA polymerase sigma-70 factor [Pedobacter riviphilus]